MNRKKVGNTSTSFEAEKDDLMKTTDKKTSKQRMIQMIHISGKIILPSLTAAFVMFYIFGAMYLYSNPTLYFRGNI